MEQKDNYIGELVEELDAFTPVMSAFSLAFIWTVAAFIIVSFVSLSIASFRHDLLSLNQFTESPRFMLELFTGVGVVFATTLVVFSLSTPGENTKRNITIAFLLISVFASLFIYSFHSPSTHVSMAGKRLCWLCLLCLNSSNHACWVYVYSYTYSNSSHSACFYNGNSRCYSI